MKTTPSSDTEAILLLCGHFKDAAADSPPLALSEYYKLTTWLRTTGIKPAQLLSNEDQSRLMKDLMITGLDPDRIIKLLLRKESLAQLIEGWAKDDLWALSQFDDGYPIRFRERLGTQSPAIIYGAGKIELLNRGGLSIVGSRDVDEAGTMFARETAAGCAKIGVQIVSGGARGVDSEAMNAAMEAGGSVVGILADSLAGRATSGRYKDAVQAGLVTLISPSHPGAGFNAGLAMARNKLIYALSDRALVVNSAFGTGGTWSGARENLKHGWAPLYVRSGEDVPEGNRKLLELGGLEAVRVKERKVIEFEGWRDVPGFDFDGEIIKERRGEEPEAKDAGQGSLTFS